MITGRLAKGPACLALAALWAKNPLFLLLWFWLNIRPPR